MKLHRELERKFEFHKTGVSNIQLHNEERMAEPNTDNSSAWHYMRQIVSFTFEIFINSDYVRVIRTRITATTQCTLDVIGARDDRDIGDSISRLDLTTIKSQRITLSRKKREANLERGKIVRPNLKERRSSSSSNHLTESDESEREGERGRRIIVILEDWECASRRDARIAIDDVRSMIDGSGSTYAQFHGF